MQLLDDAAFSISQPGEDNSGITERVLSPLTFFCEKFILRYTAFMQCNVRVTTVKNYAPLVYPTGQPFSDTM